jgi:protein arginine kinase
MNLVTTAAKQADSGLITNRSVTSKERERLLAQRVISPNFQWSLPGRAVMYNQQRTLSALVNEEDHLRVQALRDSDDIQQAERDASAFINELERHLTFARSTEQGFLASSVYNCGEGRRYSTMMHLVGLSHDESRGEVFDALMEKKITVRGLFGEGSRPIGAFAQVSTTLAPLGEFMGAVDYLTDLERAARKRLEEPKLLKKAKEALDYVKASPRISLPNAFRVLGWLRWAVANQIAGFPIELRRIDLALNSLDLLMHENVDYADGKRADTLRELLDL